jgi:hypothetical protein
LTSSGGLKEIQLNKIAFPTVALLGLAALTGCHTWEAVPYNTMWESGETSAANWKTNAGPKALDKITVLERTSTVQPDYDADYVRTCYNAISNMLATARPDMGQNDAFDSALPVLYATTVDLNDFDSTTNFGRLVSESLATALTQHWRNKVIKMTLRQGQVPIVPRQGEFLLSREAQEVASDYNAGAVLVSTYSVALDKVYINIELVNVNHNAVVASTMFWVPLGPRTHALLRGQEFPAAGPESAVSYSRLTTGRRR